MSWSAHLARHLCCRSALLGVVLAAALVSGCREQGDIQVKSLTFEGVEGVDEGALKSALVTKESSWLPWGDKKYFDRSRFDADLKRIAAFYADQGFPDAKVRSVDVQMNDDQTAVSLTVEIDEGEPIVVDEVRFEGFDALGERAQRRLQRTAALETGQPLNRQQLAATTESALSILRNSGYPYASVSGDAQLVPGQARRVVVTVRAATGPLAEFGPIEVAGNASVGEDIILRQLAFKPGDPWRRNRVQESQQRLYGLELFEFANVEPVHVENQPTAVPMRVTVAEGKHRRVNFGVGYGTEEKARVDAQWRHANFFGDARTAGIAARWSSLDRGVRTEFTQPYFLGPHLTLGISAQGWNTAEPAYSATWLGGRVTLRHQTGPRARNSWAVTFVNEYQRTAATEEALADPSFRDDLIALGLDPVDGTQDGTLVGFEIDLQHSTVPGSLLNPRRGYSAALHLEQGGGWLPGSFDYYSAAISVRAYVPLPRRAVFANRLQIGGLAPIGRARLSDGQGARPEFIPFSKRYFLGGSTSLRGWGRFEVSPLTDTGLPVGGFSMLEMGSELRVPVWGQLSLVGFVDAGNVWEDSWQYELNDLRVAVGPGVRYQTPIGPVRMDFGYQLTPIDGLLVDGEPEKRRWRVHFSIGQAF